MAAPTSSERLIIALDVSDRKSALGLVEQVDGLGVSFKVGSQLFTAEGPPLVKEIVSSGARVFLDLKFHDIPNTVAGAVASALGLGASIVNVHGLGGSDMMTAAARAARETVLAGGSQGKAENGRPAVIAVTVLTSMNHDGLNEVGVGEGVQAAVVRLARLAKASGLDGVVASPREVRLIRENVSASNFLIVTPGVRPDGCLAEDQKRVATPTQAITDGADFIVVGRPITSDPNPRAAAERILEEISSATK